MLQEQEQRDRSAIHQLAVDFRPIDHSTIRIDACQRMIEACQTTIEQYLASEMDTQDENAKLVGMHSEKAQLQKHLIKLVQTFSKTLHARMQSNP